MIRHGARWTYPKSLARPRRRIAIGPVSRKKRSSRPLRAPAAVSRKNFLLQILLRLPHIFRPAEIAPIIAVGAKRQNLLSASCQP
jgi:hypothetical protein